MAAEHSSELDFWHLSLEVRPDCLVVVGRIQEHEVKLSLKSRRRGDGFHPQNMSAPLRETSTKHGLFVQSACTSSVSYP